MNTSVSIKALTISKTNNDFKKNDISFNNICGCTFGIDRKYSYVEKAVKLYEL